MSRTADDQARVDQLLHRLPARTGGVEHERIEPPASSSARRVTSGVVTPNIVSPTAAGHPALAGIGLATMPAIALAALPSTCREMRLRPATSVTEYIMAMSEGPTYGATFDDATRRHHQLRHPTGRARMAGVTSAVPPDPPAPMMPASSPAWATT